MKKQTLAVTSGEVVGAGELTVHLPTAQTMSSGLKRPCIPSCFGPMPSVARGAEANTKICLAQRIGSVSPQRFCSYTQDPLGDLSRQVPPHLKKFHALAEV